ncbi:MAG: FAD-binding protein, partial [Clostridia bacterium]|nr:FAD-binding protein [Clostridia bacterium]
IAYRLNTKATGLLTQDGAVTGIMAQTGDVTYEIRAKAVILATGGYLANRELVAQYKPGYENNGFDVTIGCDGSGLLMALEVGAVAKHMDICGFHALAASYNGVSRSLTNPAGAGCIAVNAAGERYANEAGAYADFTAATMEEGQVFCIMDETVMNQGRIKNDTGLSNITEMYTICDTLEELAAELGIDPAGLVATAERYGEFVRNGVDEDFGKAATGLTGDFSKGPYYGVKANVENHTVYGGIEIDNNGHVLDESGDIIGGLYAAGEVAMFKTGGRAPLPECVDMGREAARSIKAELGA